ncbi:hypothetical protein GE061_020005 [Apolygus lucorum]|uniref:Uncharacterized protein n=1 Tax=Apolygus lucorum TaxID=248454 RepID=A0A8S9XBZ9_APOLU|nr:hypothetical protein GE061_020005 [Apolygus lucorum]
MSAPSVRLCCFGAFYFVYLLLGAGIFSMIEAPGEATRVRQLQSMRAAFLKEHSCVEVVRDEECVATPLLTIHPRSGTSSDTFDDSSLDRYIDAAIDRAVRTIDESAATVNHLTATTPDLTVNRVVDTPYRHTNATKDTDIGTPNRHTDTMMNEIIGTPTRHTIATPEVVVATPDVVVATPNTVVATPDRHTNTNVAMVVATPDMVVATPNEHTIATFDTVLATPENKNEIKFSEISTTSQIEPKHKKEVLTSGTRRCGTRSIATTIATTIATPTATTTATAIATKVATMNNPQEVQWKSQ